MRLSGTKTGAINQYRGLGNQLWDLAGNRPSLDLPFADNKSLVDATTGANLVDFTRASSGTYVDSEGVIRTATTNLLLRSEEFDTTWVQPGIVSANTEIAPNGTLTADTITSGGGAGSVYQNVSVLASTIYTASVYVKLGTMPSSDYKIAVYNNSASNFIAADVTPSQTPNSSGWTRVTYTFTTPVGCTSVRWYPFRNGSAIPLSTVYLWGAQLEQSTTVGEYIPTTSTINSAPRFDHDPTTGESLGLLVEKSKTNSIRNNTMVGAVAGTPGTVPVNWTAGGNAALSREIVGTGIENGISYIDIRFFGTVASVAVPEMAIIFDSNQTAVAAASQAWTASSYLKVVGGSLSNVINGEIFVLGFNSSFVLTEASSTAFNYSTLTGALQTGRVSHTRTLLTGTTVRVNSRVDINFTVGGGVDADITLRIGLPQLEQGAFATSVIPTTDAAATRAADVASISGSNFSSWYRQDEGTVFTEFRDSPSTQGEYPFAISDNTVSNRLTLFTSGSSSLNSRLISAGSVFNPGNVSFIASSLIRACTAGKTGADQAITACNGVLSNAGSPTSMPVVNRMYIGAAHNGLEQTNGTIRRLTYWPARLPNETLQTITQ